MHAPDAALVETVQDVMERWSIPGIAIGILDGGKETRHGFGVASLETQQPVTEQTLFQIGSISKVFTATLVMRLVEDGVLDLDTPVSGYLPDLSLADEAALRTITLRHLLSHTSGLEGDRFTDYGMGDDALTRAIAEFSSLRQLTRPGEIWTYCNSGFYLAGAVIERVLDTTFEAAMRERIFEPLKLERSFFFAHEAIVYPVAVGHTPTSPGAPEHEIARRYPLPRCVNAAGGIISTVGDLLRFAALHLNGGTLNGQRVLSGESVAAMQEPQTQAANFAEAYGIGWALDTIDGARIVSHGGTTNGFQAHLAFLPGHDFAIATLTNSGRGAAAYREIEDWAFAHYRGLRRSQPAIAERTDDELAWFAGEYRRPHADITISVGGGTLRADVVSKSPLDGRETKLPPITLQPIGEREFIITEGEQKGTRVDFIPSEQGTPRFIRFGGRLAEWQGTA